MGASTARSNVGLPLQQVRNILFYFSTELDQALVQCRLPTSESKYVKAALPNRSRQLKKKEQYMNLNPD